MVQFADYGRFCRLQFMIVAAFLLVLWGTAEKTEAAWSHSSHTGSGSGTGTHQGNQLSGTQSTSHSVGAHLCAPTPASCKPGALDRPAHHTSMHTDRPQVCADNRFALSSHGHQNTHLTSGSHCLLNFGARSCPPVDTQKHCAPTTVQHCSYLVHDNVRGLGHHSHHHDPNVQCAPHHNCQTGVVRFEPDKTGPMCWGIFGHHPHHCLHTNPCSLNYYHHHHSGHHHHHSGHHHHHHCVIDGGGTQNPPPVPEPGSLMLLGSGALMFSLAALRKLRS